MNRQNRYDLEMEKDRLGDRLVAEVKELSADVVNEEADDQPPS